MNIRIEMYDAENDALVTVKVHREEQGTSDSCDASAADIIREFIESTFNDGTVTIEYPIR